MSNIQLFSFNNHEIRTVTINNEPWFVLSDVCKVLEIGNPSDVKTRLEDGVVSIEGIPDALGRLQQATIINEDGLYDVILDSRKTEAKKFRKWITKDVLPSIRKTGQFSVVDPLQQYLQMSDEDRAIAYFVELKQKKEIEQQLEAAQPMIEFTKTVLKADDVILIRELSKIIQDEGIKLGEKKLYQKLRDWGLVLKNSTEPSQLAMNHEYLVVEEKPVFNKYGGQILSQTTKVTSKGQVYIINKLKKEMNAANV